MYWMAAGYLPFEPVLMVIQISSLGLLKQLFTDTHFFSLAKVCVSTWKMTLNTQRERKETLRRRASTPIPSSHQSGPRNRDPPSDPHHPPLGHSASYHPGDKSIHSRANWSSDSEESDSSEAECLYRVVLLGEHGVGKSSLANIFAGIQEKDAHNHIEGMLTFIYRKELNNSANVPWILDSISVRSFFICLVSICRHNQGKILASLFSSS